MNNWRVLGASFVGAVAGGVAGYLFFTDAGRRVRRQIEPALNDFAREFASFRETAVKASAVATDSWKLVTEALDEAAPAPPPRYPGRQTSPF